MPVITRRAVRALRLAAGRVVRGEGERGAAEPVRRPRRQARPQERRDRASATRTNPLLEGLQLRRRPEPCILVIFGASGDLTSKKLMPALYSLAVRRLLPEQFAIVGAARIGGDATTTFRERMKQAVKESRARPVRRGGVGAARRRDALRDARLRRRRRPRTGCATRSLVGSTRRAARRATASTTSPCRRARSATLVGEIAQRRRDARAGSG